MSERGGFGWVEFGWIGLGCGCRGAWVEWVRYVGKYESSRHNTLEYFIIKLSVFRSKRPYAPPPPFNSFTRS